METSVKYVGLDYHQHSVQVCVMEKSGQVSANRSCANECAAIARCVGEGPVRAAIEACSGAANLADELVARGWSVSLAHPGYVARMKQSPDKTDFTDARMLADLERVGYLPRVWLAPEMIRELRLLVRERHSWAKERTATKLRIRALLREQRIQNRSARPWTQAWMAWLLGAPLSAQGRWVRDRELGRLQNAQRMIQEAEERLEEVTANDAMIARLRSHKGIGLVTACVLRAAIGRFDRFRTGKQLARFCGLSPRNASSGARQADAGLIDACDHYLRATLIEAAHRLVRLERPWGMMAARLRARGKPASLAVAAVANRWVRRLFHEMRPMGLAAAA